MAGSTCGPRCRFWLRCHNFVPDLPVSHWTMHRRRAGSVRLGATSNAEPSVVRGAGRRTARHSRPLLPEDGGQAGAVPRHEDNRLQAGLVGCLEHALTVLVAALVVLHLAGKGLVTGGEGFPDLDDGLVVKTGPRLFPAQRRYAVGDGGTIGVFALIGVDLGQVGLRERSELGSYLGRRHFVVVPDRRAALCDLAELSRWFGPRCC